VFFASSIISVETVDFGMLIIALLFYHAGEVAGPTARGNLRSDTKAPDFFWWCFTMRREGSDPCGGLRAGGGDHSGAAADAVPQDPTGHARGPIPKMAL